MVRKALFACVALVGCMALGSCTSMGGAHTMSIMAPGLQFSLTGPAEIVRNTTSAHDPVKFTLSVMNHGSSDYKGSSPSSLPVKVSITMMMNEIGHGPDKADTQQTDIMIAAGQSKDYEVSCSVDNDKLPQMGSVMAEATFLPTGEKVMVMIPVKSAQ